MIPDIKSPDLSTARKILAVQPHYDDNDIGAGGSLYLLAQDGTEIVYLTVTNDLTGIIPQEGDRILSQAESASLLQANQVEAASVIGVQKQIRLGFPDAGNYDYFQLRDRIIHTIRKEKPDFIFTVDPWTPYEAHHDHVITGKACSEAAILYGLPAIGQYEVHEMKDYALKGVVFYNSAYPNLTFDITKGISAKQRALRAYSAQFSDADLAILIQQTTFLAGYLAREEAFDYGEALKVLAPWMLHGVALTKIL